MHLKMNAIFGHKLFLLKFLLQMSYYSQDPLGVGHLLAERMMPQVV